METGCEQQRGGGSLWVHQRLYGFDEKHFIGRTAIL
jgi:hypothetical protein